MTVAMDKLPEDWLFVTLNRIEERQGVHAAEMRLGLQEIRTNAANHALADSQFEGDIKGRVKALEVAALERSGLRQRLESGLIASGMFGLAEWVKHLQGWK